MTLISRTPQKTSKGHSHRQRVESAATERDALQEQEADLYRKYNERKRNGNGNGKPKPDKP